MKPIVLGSTGRLGRFLRYAWGETEADWRGRDVVALGPGQIVIDMRGVVPGKGDVYETVRLTERLLDRAVAAKAGRVFLASTAAVYGRMTSGLCEDRSAPESDYGHAKRMMEEVAEASGHPVTCLRIGNVAGADAILGGYAPGFQLDQFEDGTTPRRSYIGPLTFARVVRSLTQTAPVPPILNLSCPGSIQMSELLVAADFRWNPRPAGPSAIRNVCLDTTRLERLVQFRDTDQRAATMVAEYKQVIHDTHKAQS